MIIGFVGSVFSPYYYTARNKHHLVDPMDFAAFNVAVYSKNGRLWAFSEKPRHVVRRSPEQLVIGSSTMEMTDGGLTVNFDEQTVVAKKRIKGSVRLETDSFLNRSYSLAPSGKHLWCPIAPLARIDVALEAPSLRFTGAGYADANFGEEPLEAAFDQWTWSRHAAEDNGYIFYDGICLDGTRFSRSFHCGPSDSMVTIDSPPFRRLPRTLPWGGTREVRSEDDPRLVKTLESSPFYSRSIVESRIEGIRTLGVQETLRMDKFTTPIMQKMLPFRITRENG